jgi:hypothetical protein
MRWQLKDSFRRCQYVQSARVDLMQQFFFMIGQRLSAGVSQWTTKP